MPQKASFSQRWIEIVIQQKKAVIAGVVLVTVGLLTQVSGLKVLLDPDTTLPQTHPLIATGNEVERLFGNRFSIVIGVTSKEGTVFQPEVLERVKRITDEVVKIPGAVRSNVLSLSARRAKAITGTKEGMEVRAFYEKVPTTPAALDDLKAKVLSQSLYQGVLVSKDLKTTQIIAEFKKTDGGFRGTHLGVEKILKENASPNIEYDLGGTPVFLSLLEKFSARMGFLFPLAVLIIGLIHYEAFRTVQALVLPLVTALLAVVWAVGLLGISGQPFDVFNSSTPILILAIAAGHAVQILKRYYEEFVVHSQADPQASPEEWNRRAIQDSLRKVAPVMLVAGGIAAIGFLSLIVFDIKTIRTFGVFTAAGIVSAMILELTLIPALRAWFKPPSAREIQREQAQTFWDRLVHRFYTWSVLEPKKVFIGTAVSILLLGAGGVLLKIDNSQKKYFYSAIPELDQDSHLNETMAGTNPYYLLIRGKTEDAIKDPAVLKGMDLLQREIEKDPQIGKSISIVDLIKRMNRAMNGDAQKFDAVPQSQDLIAQYLFLYSNSGEPGDFDTYVDVPYQNAVITFFAKSDSSRVVQRLTDLTLEKARMFLPPSVEFSVGGGTTGGLALNQVMIREKILNILQIMAAVFVVSALVFRSVFAGLLILVPLVAAVAVNFGVMGLLGIPLQIGTALVSAMAVGIGADYGIYMSFRMREELRRASGSEKEEKKALEKAFQSAGKATLFVSSAVAGGFGVLVFSYGFMVHLYLGFLVSLAMLVSSFAALTLFPALIFKYRPKFIFENESKNRKENNLKSSLKSTQTATLILLASALTAIPAFQSQAADSGAGANAIEIAKKSFEVGKVIDSESEATMTLTNANGQSRVRQTKGSSKLKPGSLDNRSLVRFLSPADVRGTATLTIENNADKKDDDIWIFLPALKKVRRLVASNKKDSFVGTDFSYGDVIGHRVEEWNHKVLKQEAGSFVLESTPISESIADNSGYSKRVSWVDQKNFYATKSELYDRSGQLLKVITLSNHKNADPKRGKWVPLRLEAKNVQTGHQTVIEFTKYESGVGVSDSLFKAANLEK